MQKEQIKTRNPETRALAHGRYLKISPTKVQDIVALVRGKSLTEAGRILKFSGRKGARLVIKVLRSAEANAGSVVDKENWVVTKATADKGPRFRRRIDPKPRGASGTISTYSTHLTMGIGPLEPVPTTEETGTKEEPKSAPERKKITKRERFKKQLKPFKKEVKNAT